MKRNLLSNLTMIIALFLVPCFAFAKTTAPPPPVQIVEFIGILAADDQIELNWTTSYEYNNQYFAVQYSTNGRDFETLDYVNGAAISLDVVDYTYIHYTPMPGANYYRLKQIDFSGGFNFSETVELVIEEPVIVNTYPTIVNSQLEITIEQIFDQNHIIDINNLMGKVVKRFIFPAGTDYMQLDLENLESGYYFLILHNQNAIVHNTRFVKLSP